MNDVDRAQPDTGSPVPPTAGTRAIDGRREFEAALREALDLAARQGCRELWVCDSDFADWPLGERAVLPLLEAWAYSHRRFVMLAQHYDAVARQHARFVTWRRQWSHVVECWVLPPEIQAAQAPSFLIAPGVVTVRLFDPVLHRGVLELGSGRHERETLALADAVLQRSEPGFPASTLGL
jgi:hypothetical protein